VPRQRSRQASRPRAPSLAEALSDPACYDHEVERVQVAETHISWVFLTGKYAYKVKKPVKLPFLDFSTLHQRRHFCEEELRLNRRLAPDLYLGVVPIGGSPAAPRVGRKPAFEYAVKMRQFDADARLDERLKADAIPSAALTEFASRLAQFHRGLSVVRRDRTGGSAPAAALDNFDVLAPLLAEPQRSQLRRLRVWTERSCADLAGVFAARVAAGAERECHGDLHLENLLWRDGGIVAYDALEFDRKLREIDVVSETSFLAMDLMAHGRTDLAYEFLNRYFEASGDYEGLHVLRFYLVYRALVRAKVRAIKAQQSGAKVGANPYLDTAAELTTARTPLLLITHGLSGSGKTYHTDRLIGRLPALRARSDIERKRLHGLEAAARTSSAVGQGLYAAAANRRTYAALGRIADCLLRHGFNAIVDATFLHRAEREQFRQIAAANAARFAILDFTAPADELRRRITARAATGRDASEATLAVLDRQQRDCEPLAHAERRATVHVDTSRPVSDAKLLAAIATR